LIPLVASILHTSIPRCRQWWPWTPSPRAPSDTPTSSCRRRSTVTISFPLDPPTHLLFGIPSTQSAH
jgi:hypothetical protein